PVVRVVPQREGPEHLRAHRGVHGRGRGPARELPALQDDAGGGPAVPLRDAADHLPPDRQRRLGPDGRDHRRVASPGSPAPQRPLRGLPCGARPGEPPPRGPSPRAHPGRYGAQAPRTPRTSVVPSPAATAVQAVAAITRPATPIPSTSGRCSTLPSRSEATANIPSGNTIDHRDGT